jgi:hypothetical protein
MMNGITEIAESVSSELKHRLPKQRKTQRTKLALLVSTMLEVRSANLMDLAAGLPRDADRTDMRYQWIIRLLGNPLVISDAIMEPFAREVPLRANDGFLATFGDQVPAVWPQSPCRLTSWFRFTAASPKVAKSPMMMRHRRPGSLDLRA